MIIDDYIQLLDRIDDLGEEIEAVTAELSKIELDKKQLATDKATLQREKAKQCEVERDRVVRETIAAEQQPYKDQITNLQADLKGKQDSTAQSLSEIEAKNYNLLFEEEFMIINDCLDLIRSTRSRINDLFDYSVAERIKDAVANQHTTIEGIIALRNLVDEKLQVVSLVQKKSILERGLTFVFPPPEKIANHPASLQILKFVITLMFVSFFLFRIPALLVAVYTGFISFGVLRDIKNTKNLLEAYYPYKYLEFHCIKLRDLLEQEAAARKAQEIFDLKDELGHYEIDINSRISNLMDVISSVPDKVMSTLNKDEVDKRVAAMYRDRLSTIVSNIEKQDKKYRVKHGDLSNKLTELKDLEAQKGELKAELEKAVMTLESVGSSKLLLKTFFLGFGDQDRLITMDYKGETTLVMYSGEDSSCVTSFIRMMIIQYFTNMLINNLFIDIVDVINSGTAFDVFRYKDLKDIINIVSTSDAVSTLISGLHKEMRERSEKISVIADNIDKFNEIMIQRDSFTMEYRIVIFNTCDEDVLKSVQFLQLCKNGPRVGIVPIVFVNVLDMPNLESKKKKKGQGADGESTAIYKIWLEFLKSISQFFNFNSDTSEVTALGASFKGQVVNKLSTLI